MIYEALGKDLDSNIEEEVTLEVDGVEVTGCFLVKICCFLTDPTLFE